VARKNVGKRIPNKEVRAIAERRMRRLMGIAKEEARAGEDDLARRHVDLALRIAKRNNARMDWSMTCKACKMPLLPGFNCRVRSTGGRMSLTCLKCGEIKRKPYLKEKRA
jgi:ribonuclease P protein subunit RPR2